MNVILSADLSTHMPWIVQNARHLIQAALRYYPSAGRGALVVGWKNYDPQSDSFSADYFTDRDLRRSGTGWPTLEVAEWVRDYDPAHEFILVLIEPGGIDKSYAYRVVFAGDRVLRFVPTA